MTQTAPSSTRRTRENVELLSAEERGHRLLVAVLGVCATGRQTASAHLCKEACDKLTALRVALDAAEARQREAVAAALEAAATIAYDYEDWAVEADDNPALIAQNVSVEIAEAIHALIDTDALADAPRIPVVESPEDWRGEDHIRNVKRNLREGNGWNFSRAGVSNPQRPALMAPVTECRECGKSLDRRNVLGYCKDHRHLAGYQKKGRRDL